MTITEQQVSTSLTNAQAVIRDLELLVQERPGLSKQSIQSTYMTIAETLNRMHNVKQQFEAEYVWPNLFNN